MNEKICEYIKNNEENIISFLKQLIQIKSVNEGFGIPGKKEYDISVFLSKYLKDAGFEVENVAADKERPNVCAVLKGSTSDPEKAIIFNGHLDTVDELEPEKWNVDPFSATEIDGKIYGRGSNDMKGGIAAAIWAAKAIKDCAIEHEGDIILILSVGEESNEGGSIGAKACIEHGYKAPFAVICEPTNLEIHTSTSTVVCFDLIVHGKAIHACSRNQVMFPQAYNLERGSAVGVDALEKALPLIEYLYKLEKEWNQRFNYIVGSGGKPYHDRQGIGAIGINPAFISGGTYAASVPGVVKVEYSILQPAEIPTESLLAEVRERIAYLAKCDDWLSENPPEINGPTFIWQGFATDEKLPAVNCLQKAYKKAENQEPIISGFKAVCDGTHFVEAGIPSVVLGPGAISDGAHGYNEFVTRDEVIKATGIYAAFMRDWCN